MKLTPAQLRLLQEGYADLTEDPDEIAFDGVISVDGYKGCQVATIYALKEAGLVFEFYRHGRYFEISWNVNPVFEAAKKHNLKTFQEIEAT